MGEAAEVVEDLADHGRNNLAHALRCSRWKGVRGSGTGAPRPGVVAEVAIDPAGRRAREAWVRFE